jgi:anti-sigma regulatory factor (Ser/Thr protein kinase)
VVKRRSHIGRKPDIDVLFSHEASAPQAARRALRTLFKHGDPLANDVATVTSELVSNVVQHTDGGGSVRAWDPKPDIPLRLEVTDGGPPIPDLPISSREVGGRGLLIVEALTDSWGVDTPAVGPGKTVWAEFERPQATPVAPDNDDDHPPAQSEPRQPE